LWPTLLPIPSPAPKSQGPPWLPQHRTPHPEGREERTVEIDPDRAELITWAFFVFAAGEWTLRSLADELETRGLTTRRTPKLPSRPVKPNVLHAILTNPYYKGEVVYRGVTHQGIHQPLIGPLTW
jgi:site-specific DNA recombinase